MRQTTTIYTCDGCGETVETKGEGALGFPKGWGINTKGPKREMCGPCLTALRKRRTEREELARKTLPRRLSAKALRHIAADEGSRIIDLARARLTDREAGVVEDLINAARGRGASYEFGSVAGTVRHLWDLRVMP